DEWEGKDTHEADSQVANDMLYFNGTYWIRATPAQIRALLNVADGADVTADNAPKAHKVSHQNGGDDEISAAGLSGLLADDQHVIDAEAVSAMGAKADANPLHHDRAEEWGAAEHTAIGNNAPHHAKYTNAEAKAAAVLAGAITDEETKAPTHDAVYDVAVIAATATTPAEVDAKITTHKNIAAAHHAKTTNAAELTSGELPTARLSTNIKTLSLTFIIDGGGVAITTGQKGHLEIPFACTIKGWTILADVSGSIVVDVWKDTYAAFPPAVGDTIAGSEKPTISGAQKGQDLTLTTWTTAIAAGNILAFNVDSCATITRVVGR
ncbi:unnamed protein product, partial [marine sediment metagenome]